MTGSAAVNERPNQVKTYQISSSIPKSAFRRTPDAMGTPAPSQHECLDDHTTHAMNKWSHNFVTPLHSVSPWLIYHCCSRAGLFSIRLCICLELCVRKLHLSTWHGRYPDAKHFYPRWHQHQSCKPKTITLLSAELEYKFKS